MKKFSDLTDKELDIVKQDKTAMLIIEACWICSIGSAVLLHWSFFIFTILGFSVSLYKAFQVNKMRKIK